MAADIFKYILAFYHCYDCLSAVSLTVLPIHGLALPSQPDYLTEVTRRTLSSRPVPEDLNSSTGLSSSTSDDLMRF